MTSWHSLPIELKRLILQHCISTALRPQEKAPQQRLEDLCSLSDLDYTAWSSPEHDAANGLINIIKAAPELTYELSRVIHLRGRTAGIARAHEADFKLGGKVLSPSENHKALQAQARRLEAWSFEIDVCNEVIRMWKELTEGSEEAVPDWLSMLYL